MAFQTSNLAKLLINGGVIVYPTETVYGIGGNALDPNVVAKIYQIKQRDPSKPLIILVKDLAMAKKFAHVEEFENILKKYWPGALTGIFQAKEVLPAGVLSDQKTIALRISPHEFIKSLFEEIDFPLISTSANKSGQPNCQSITQVKESLGNNCQLIDEFVDFGQLGESPSSTLVDFTKPTPKVLRPGPVEFTLD